MHSICTVNNESRLQPEDLHKLPHLRLLDQAHLWGLHHLRWWWECNTNTFLQQHWLVLLGYGDMHHRAVSVPLDVRVQALLGSTPLDLASLLTLNHAAGAPPPLA